MATLQLVWLELNLQHSFYVLINTRGGFDGNDLYHIAVANRDNTLELFVTFEGNYVVDLRIG